MGLGEIFMSAYFQDRLKDKIDTYLA